MARRISIIGAVVLAILAIFTALFFRPVHPAMRGRADEISRVVVNQKAAKAEPFTLSQQTAAEAYDLTAGGTLGLVRHTPAPVRLTIYYSNAEHDDVELHEAGVRINGGKYYLVDRARIAALLAKITAEPKE